MPRLRRFRPGDIGWDPGLPHYLLDVYEKYPMAYTLADDEGPIACGGVVPLWLGVCEMWSSMGPRTKKYTKKVLQYSKFVRDVAQRTLKPRRLQVVVADDPIKIRFAERLGFKKEGLMKHHGIHGEDEWMMAIIWDQQ